MKLATLVVFAFVAVIALAGSPVLMAGDGHNVSSVNGDVNTSAGETYGSLSTVNGGVHIVSGVTADRAKTRNLARDPRVTLHIASRDFWSWVAIEGTAELTPVAADEQTQGTDPGEVLVVGEVHDAQPLPEVEPRDGLLG